MHLSLYYHISRDMFGYLIAFITGTLDELAIIWTKQNVGNLRVTRR